MSMVIEGRRETKEQSDTAAIVACDRVSGVFDRRAWSWKMSSPHCLVTHSRTLGCMRDYLQTVVLYAIAIRRSRVDMTKRSSAARCLSGPVISHSLGGE